MRLQSNLYQSRLHYWSWLILKDKQSNNVLFAFIQPETVWYFNNSNLNTIFAFSFSFSKRKTKTNTVLFVRKRTSMSWISVISGPWSRYEKLHHYEWQLNHLDPHHGDLHGSSLTSAISAFFSFVSSCYHDTIVMLSDCSIGFIGFRLLQFLDCFESCEPSRQLSARHWHSLCRTCSQGLEWGKHHACMCCIVVLRTWNMKVRQNWLYFQVWYTDSQKCSIPLTSLACVCTLRDWSS